jgi:hypothetical protein
MSCDIASLRNFLRECSLTSNYDILAVEYEIAECVTMRGVDLSNGREVVIKQFDAREMSRGIFARLHHDAELLSKLDFPGIPKVIKYARSGDKLLIVLPKVVGELQVYFYLKGLLVAPRFVQQLAAKSYSST